MIHFLCDYTASCLDVCLVEILINWLIQANLLIVAFLFISFMIKQIYEILSRVFFLVQRSNPSDFISKLTIWIWKHYCYIWTFYSEIQWSLNEQEAYTKYQLLNLWKYWRGTGISQSLLFSSLMPWIKLFKQNKICFLYSYTAYYIKL